MDEEIRDITPQGNERNEQVDLARYRNLLAEERTFSAWLRTGLAAVAAGVGIGELVRTSGFSWLTRTIGLVFVIAAGIIFVLGFLRYNTGQRRLSKYGIRDNFTWLFGIISFMLLITALLAFYLLINPSC